MASKPTEMCVVEKSGAREYKVLLFVFLSVSFSALSSIIIASRLLVFSLSLPSCTLDRRVACSPSLPLADVWIWREEVERLARWCARRFRRPKSWARRDARRPETIGLMDGKKRRPRRRTAAQNRAQFNRAARDARERVGTISVRVWRGKWICPRESSATSSARWWMGRRPRVDDEASSRPFFETRDL